MAADAKFTVKDAIGKQLIHPITVSEELQEKFLKKSRKSAILLIPASLAIFAVVLTIAILLVVFVKRIVFSFLFLLCLIMPFYAVYNLFATFGAIKKGDYEFFEGVVVGKTDSAYKIRGLEEHNIISLFSKRQFNPEEKVIVARLNDELNIISE